MFYQCYMLTNLANHGRVSKSSVQVFTAIGTKFCLNLTTNFVEVRNECIQYEGQNMK